MAKKKQIKIDPKMLLDFMKAYIFPVFAVIGLALITYFVYSKYIEIIPDLYNKRERLELNKKVLTENVDVLNSLNQTPMSTMESELDKMIPTEPNVASLMESIVTLAEQSGLTVSAPVVQEEESQEETAEEAQTQEPEVDAGSEQELEELVARSREGSSEELGVKYVSINLVFSGSRNDMEQFLDALKDLDRVVSIESAEISIQGNTWNMEVVLYGYSGQIVETALPDYERISATDDKVFTPVTEIDVELSQEHFDEVTSNY